MSKAIKAKIQKMLESIEDETMLNQVMEEVVFYTSKKDTIDYLTKEQLNELDRAVAAADKKEIITWDNFKQEMIEWRKK